MNDLKIEVVDGLILINLFSAVDFFTDDPAPGLMNLVDAFLPSGIAV